MISKLYVRDSYTTSSLYEDAVIREYDMSEAGFNIIKEYKLLTPKKISELAVMTKDQRRRAIGILQIDDKKFANELKKGFETCRKNFFEANSIEDKDVISIKKDAIFIKDKVCPTTDFGNHISFKIKNKYSCFLNLNDIEFYYNEKFDELDVKGVNDDLLELHKDGMLKVIRTILKIVSSSTEEFVCSRLQKLVSDYKEFRLPRDTYRELNRFSKFKGNMKLTFAGTILVDDFDSLGEDNIDISYNFMKFIVPIINAFY